MKKLLATATLFFSSAAFAAGTPVITGKWHLSQNVAGNQSEQNCNFVQAEGTVTGTCKGTGEDDKDVQIMARSMGISSRFNMTRATTELR